MVTKIWINASIPVVSKQTIDEKIAAAGVDNWRNLSYRCKTEIDP